MPKKFKFKPVITRIALNPEQAVLACTCYDVGSKLSGSNFYGLVDTLRSCNGARGAGYYTGGNCQWPTGDSTTRVLPVILPAQRPDFTPSEVGGS